MAHVAAESPCWTWINSSDGLKSTSPKIRTLIRKQAMSKAAAARRRVRRSPPSKRQDSSQSRADQHTREIPEQISEISPIQDNDIQPLCPEAEGLHSNPLMLSASKASELVIGGLHQVSYMPRQEWIPASPSSTGFEAVRIAFDFDPTSLSCLTDIHVGRATARPLRDKPDRLREILRCKRWSYYEYLPSRFGQSRCLDDAIRCIAARVRQWFNNSAGPNRSALELYSKAVESLQAALNDPVLCHHPNVLCATEVLSLFELLDSGWNMLSDNPYTKGAASLIEFRGPQGYQSDFEKSLLHAQWGAIYTEAIQNSASCFLDEPAWQATLQSILLEKSSCIPYADAYGPIWTCVGAMPNLFRSVRSLVCSTHEPPHAVRETFLSRAYDLRCLIMDVGTKYSLTFNKMDGLETYSFVLSDEAECTERYEILGALASILMEVERYIVALNPSLAVPMEKHAQRLAIQILDLQRVSSKCHPRAVLYLSYAALAARAVLLTASEWRHETLYRAPSSVIAKPVLERWVGLHSPQNLSDDEEWRDKYGETHLPFRQD